MNMTPTLARQILERTMDNVRTRSNSYGECFGGEIMDCMREAGKTLGADRLEVLLTRTLLVRIMESMGEEYPAEVLQDYERRMPVSKALKCLSEAIESTTRLKDSTALLGI